LPDLQLKQENAAMAGNEFDEGEQAIVAQGFA
jgi:hypothetical protein